MPFRDLPCIVINTMCRELQHSPMQMDGALLQSSAQRAVRSTTAQVKPKGLLLCLLRIGGNSRGLSPTIYDVMAYPRNMLSLLVKGIPL